MEAAGRIDAPMPLQADSGQVHAGCNETVHDFAVEGRGEQQLEPRAAGSDAAGGGHGGAPAQACEVSLGVARHPDAIAFNAAFWACVGDPADALAALGG